MNDEITLQILDETDIKPDESFEVALESDSYSEYKMRCEVHGIAPKSEKAWWAEHCGGVVLEIDTEKLDIPILLDPSEVSSMNEFKTLFSGSETTTNPLLDVWRTRIES